MPQCGFRSAHEMGYWHVGRRDAGLTGATVAGAGWADRKPPRLRSRELNLLSVGREWPRADGAPGGGAGPEELQWRAAQQGAVG
jgi:hypothetical protein